MTNTVAEQIEFPNGCHAFRLEKESKWRVAKWSNLENRYEFYFGNPCSRPVDVVWGRRLHALASEGIPSYTKATALRRAEAGRYWK